MVYAFIVRIEGHIGTLLSDILWQKFFNVSIHHLLSFHLKVFQHSFGNFDEVIIGRVCHFSALVLMVQCYGNSLSIIPH